MGGSSCRRSAAGRCPRRSASPASPLVVTDPPSLRLSMDSGHRRYPSGRRGASRGPSRRGAAARGSLVQLPPPVADEPRAVAGPVGMALHIPIPPQLAAPPLPSGRRPGGQRCRRGGGSGRAVPALGGTVVGVESAMTNLPSGGWYPPLGGGNLPTQFSSKSGRTFGEGDNVLLA